MPSLLKAADVLVLPSRWEGMPNVVLEAMAAGLAVVGTAVEGTEDLVVAGETGWLVPPGDSEALAVALIEANDDSKSRRERGEAGRERVRRDFSQERVVAAYDRLWSAVLGYRRRVIAEPYALCSLDFGCLRTLEIPVVLASRSGGIGRRARFRS